MALDRSDPFLFHFHFITKKNNLAGGPFIPNSFSHNWKGLALTIYDPLIFMWHTVVMNVHVLITSSNYLTI